MVQETEFPARDQEATELSWKSGWVEAVDAFIRELKALGYSQFTRRDYRCDVMRMGARLDCSPTEVSYADIERLLDDLAREGMPLNARRRRQSAYRRFCAFMLEQRPSELDSPAMTRMGSRLWSAMTLAPPCDRVLVGLIYFCGLRLSEIAELEGRDLKLRKRMVTTRLGWRVLPMDERLSEALEDLRRVSPFQPFRALLTGPQGYAVNSRTLHSRFQRITTDFGFAGLKPDALRREAASQLGNAGAPPNLVTAFLGRDRGRPLAPRRGRHIDLTCLRKRIEALPAS